MPTFKRRHHSSSLGLLYPLPLHLSLLCLLFALNLACTPKQGANPNTPKSNTAIPNTATLNTIEYSTHSLDVGIDFKYQNGEAAWLAAMIESNGGGIGWIDYDRD
ncbi:MAG: hypothetical protein RL240_2373, partial [Planctomycetota bacterium]